MSAEVFLDTNIFVYCFDADNPSKQTIAKKLVSQGGVVCELAGDSGVFLGRTTSLQGATELRGLVGLHRTQALAGMPHFAQSSYFQSGHFDSWTL
ncbi:MAG: hypothetical protein EBU61_03895, partial [Crocinitomicaceae bacterium]|nr:hypothetical protein [Crocinitomicaceae bacterium]